MYYSSLQDIVNQWISIDSVPSLGVSSPLNSVSDMASTSSGLFLGEDTSELNCQGIDIYKKLENLPTAISSILNHCQTKANFHPLVNSPEVDAQAFGKYITIIDRTPFFHLEINEITEQKFYTKDYKSLIKSIVDLYKGVSSGDISKIEDSITNMATSVFGQKKSDIWKNLFSQSTIDYTDMKNPKIKIYYTTLNMFHNKENKSEISQQTYRVAQAEYKVLSQLTQTYAETLARLTTKSVDDFISEMTSHQENGVIRCF